MARDDKYHKRRFEIEPDIPNDSRKLRGRRSDNEDMPHPQIDTLSLIRDT